MAVAYTPPISPSDTIHAFFAGTFRASMNQSLYEAYIGWHAGGGALPTLMEWLAQTEEFAKLYTAGNRTAFANELTASLLSLPSAYDFAAADAVPEFLTARDWVVSLLNEGQSAGGVAYTAISALLASTNGAFLDAQLRLQHQSIVSQYYVASGGNAGSLEELQSVLNGVTADSRSLNQALAAIDLNPAQAASTGPFPGRFSVVEDLADGKVAWISVVLVANRSYVIQASAAPGATLDPAIFAILDQNGKPVEAWTNDNYAGHAAQLTITPSSSGTFQIGIKGENGTIGLASVALRDVTEAQRVPQWHELALNTVQEAMIDEPFSRHEFSLYLASHQKIAVTISSLVTAADPLMRPKIIAVRDPEGSVVSDASIVASAFGSATMHLTANIAGTYKLTIGDSYNDMGAYRIEAVAQTPTPPVASPSAGDDPPGILTTVTELPSNRLTPAHIAPGDDLSGKVDTVGDIDWIRVSLTENHRYEVTMQGLATGKGTLPDPFIAGILDSKGEAFLSTSDDDSGTGQDAKIGFVAPDKGDYYIAVQGYGRQTGSYTLSLDDQGPAHQGSTVTRPVSPEDLGTWTILVYMAADNDLEPFAILDLNEMEAATLPFEANVLVGVDRIAGYDTSNGNWTDSRVGVIGYDVNNSLIGSGLSSVGELNMGNPATLTDFIDWAVQERPAQHYALVIWNHGDGINGVAFDETSGNDSLSIHDIRDAIAASIPGSLDIVGFDTCSMAFIEQADALADVAGFMVASQELEPGEGWDYESWLSTAFADGAAIDAQTLAFAAVNSFQDTYNGQSDITLSALALKQIPSVTQALEQFIGASDRATPQDWAAIKKAYFQATYFSSSDSVDLGDFANLLELQGNLSPEISAAAAVLSSSADAAVIAATENLDHAYGLSIFWPSYRPHDFLETYAAEDIPMLDTVQWDVFLQNYWGIA